MAAKVTTGLHHSIDEGSPDSVRILTGLGTLAYRQLRLMQENSNSISLIPISVNGHCGGFPMRNPNTFKIRNLKRDPFIGVGEKKTFLGLISQPHRFSIKLSCC